MATNEPSQNAFNRDDAMGFLEKKLKILDAKNLLANDPATLLDRITQRFSEVQPFSNITVLSAPVGAFGVPGLEKIRSDGLAARGGLCYGNNMFLWELVCALGYKAHIGGGCVIQPLDHLVLIVTSLPSGGGGGPRGTMYLLDHGYPLPLGRAIPLDFDGEFLVDNLGHSVYKITREGDTYTRFNAKRGKTFVSSQEFAKADAVVEWKRALSLSTDPIDVNEFAKVMVFPYTEYFGTFGNLLFAVTRGDVLHNIEDFDKSTSELSVKHHEMRPDGTVTSLHCTVDDIVQCIKEIGTVFSDDELRRAIENLAHYKKEFIKKNGLRVKEHPENDGPV